MPSSRTRSGIHLLRARPASLRPGHDPGSTGPTSRIQFATAPFLPLRGQVRATAPILCPSTPTSKPPLACPGEGRGLDRRAGGAEALAAGGDQADFAGGASSIAGGEPACFEDDSNGPTNSVHEGAQHHCNTTPATPSFPDGQR